MPSLTSAHLRGDYGVRRMWGDDGVQHKNIKLLYKNTSFLKKRKTKPHPTENNRQKDKGGPQTGPEERNEQNKKP